LRERGAIVIDPAVGRLTGADSGPGRLPEPEEIARVGRAALARGGLAPDLTGRTVVVSAGGTREYLDPVRFLGNRSSGRQGYALARTAVSRGASVVLVSANVSLPEVAGARTVRVGSAVELREAVLKEAINADAVVMAAAVADFRPAARAEQKIKKVGDEGVPPPVELVRNPDILAELGSTRSGPYVLVGFAAETHDALTHGHDKLRRKGCDLLVVNEVGEGRGFEVEHNAATILTADGGSVDVPSTTKDLLAHAIWDHVVDRIGSR
jgi:phosphopantothenoylcysteine decarboxylase/phosphopantothenate--cysteine ligase